MKQSRSTAKALANPLYPTPDLARFHLGRALAQQGDLQASMEMLEDAVTIERPQHFSGDDTSGIRARLRQNGLQCPGS